MDELYFSGAVFSVCSATDLADDAETIEFRRRSNLDLVIAVTQRGNFGSLNLSVYVPQEIDLVTLEDAIEYAKHRLGAQSREMGD